MSFSAAAYLYLTLMLNQPLSKRNRFSEFETITLGKN